MEQVSKVDSPIFQEFQKLAVLLISNPHSDQLILFSPLHLRNFLFQQIEAFIDRLLLLFEELDQLVE